LKYGKEVPNKLNAKKWIKKRSIPYEIGLKNPEYLPLLNIYSLSIML